MTQSGKPEEKLELAFRLYDIDRNGSIDEHEMAEIIKVRSASQCAILLLSSNDCGSHFYFRSKAVSVSYPHPSYCNATQLKGDDSTIILFSVVVIVTD